MVYWREGSIFAQITIFIIMKICMDNIDKIITETINKDVKETASISIQPITSTKAIRHKNMITEMARINKNEMGKCIFPYSSWELKIWSNDHNPPHFHILCDGWNVSFRIDDGEVLQIEGKGVNASIFEYMRNNVKEWLSSTCFTQPKLTNKENAILQWEQLHDN